jgi:hypothetical protein
MTLALDTARLDEYLARLFGEPVEMVALRSLGGEVIDDPKGFGYGKPFEIECRVAGQGLRPRLSGRPGLAGALRPRRLQRFPAPRS